MSDGSRDFELRAAMRELIGQFATPSWLKHRARTLEAEGLMKFYEWPSGHWSLTDKGRNFLASAAETPDDDA